MKKLFLSIFLTICLIFFLDYGCIYRNIFDIPCPGCGMTRAWISFLNGKINDAFYYHPLFWSVPIIMLLVIFENKIKNKKMLSILFIIFAILFIGVYLYRLIFNKIP